ncbi:NtaA/DmoA family FMN-dependent monooxygenase [Gordonia soli]|uniref:Putative FMNH2-dependent monooxygenase n=1 Tax=Gordonia soli NBRC 108243 TaxID=1223545 RepID=M0QP57_9ACTN|nr:NtaA/DmoA family FMN-dependent monooxygenase [Gordonia soli]GAC69227.1 putative FMNH2-dependent monooxygenase [Gordonia soli NBRC 108243]
MSRRDDGEQLHLNINILPSGSHPAAWRSPTGRRRGFVDIGLYQEIGRIAERGKLDAIFLADTLALPKGVIQSGPTWALDPVVILTSVAAVTEKLGLIGTASSTFFSPWTLARSFLSLDHASNGRAGWNLVTTSEPSSAFNFGPDPLPPKQQRYAQASEFSDIVRALWDSWSDDALIADPESAVFADPDQITAPAHSGDNFSVAGPLALPRTAQGRPLLVQAGGSPEGRDLAARHADALFNAQLTLAGAQSYYSDLKARAEAYGRHPGDIAVLPGVEITVGETTADAWARKNALDDLIPRDKRLRSFAARVGIPADALSWDEPIPEEFDDPTSGANSFGFASAFHDLNVAERLPVGEIIRRGAGAHRTLVGSPHDVADSLEEWFEEHGADGFNVNIDVFPDGLERFVDLAVPELQRRGLFRREYAESTLRQRYARAT